MKKIFLIFLLFTCCYVTNAQSNVGIGTNTPHANAALEIKSNGKGLLMPRLNNSVRKSMTNVPKGMIVFDSAYNSFYYHDGSKWLAISDNNADSLLIDYGSTPEVTANITTNTITTARSGLLYDNGGPNGNYGNNRGDEYSILTDPLDDSTIGYKVVIEMLSLESPYDSLEIYAGGAYNKREVFTGNRTGTFFFINNGAGLYMDFVSNAANNAAGFRIRWSKLFTSTTTTNPAPSYGWYFNQKKLAMRGGINASNEWATDSLGIRSFAYGLKNKVKGEGATAFGTENIASGKYSFAAGYNNLSAGPFSIAMGSGSVASAGRGNNIAMGYNAGALHENTLAFGSVAVAVSNDATAIGSNATAVGAGSTAIGPYATAGGNSSMAIGVSANATATSATALGFASSASGVYSMAIGQGTKAIGDNSFAAGDKSEAKMPGSVAIGTTAISNKNYGVSIGHNTMVTGESATALGKNTTASGAASFAAGSFSTASGNAAAALGGGSNASGALSFAAGENDVSSGPNSLALGAYNTASGSGSVAIGAVNSSAGNRSVVLGTSLINSGDYATAIGTKITIPPAAAGSLGIGDLEFSNNSIDNTLLGLPNEFVARFRGGYFFMTSGNAPGGNYSARTGMKMAGGQNSWSAISDVRLKENFEPVDGEDILQKISKMKSVTWNYKAQDPTLFRHYGPMAQDFFKAFGKDKYGNIGCDTLINQQDFLGVSFVAIQALEKRTTAYQSEIEAMKMQLIALKASNELLLKKLEAIDKDNKNN